MLFKEVIGQQEVKEHLASMVQQKRLSHALLFLGREGSGALPLALAFAQYLVSLPVEGPPVADLFGGFTPMAAAPWVHPDQVEEMPAFTRAAQLIHPDLHFSYPVIARKGGDKPVSTDYISEWREFIRQSPYGNVYDWLQSLGAENKQGNITAEECNDIIRKLSFKSFESEYKVLLLWMPEYLGKEGNKLLKLVEEPPPNTIFLLVAESDEQILPTLLSRCQLIRVPLLQPAEIEAALIARSNIQPVLAAQLAAICEGNYREALQLSQHAEEDWQGLLRQWLNATLKGGPVAQAKFTEEIALLGREKQKQFLRYFNHLLGQSVRLKVLGTDQLVLADNEKDFALRLNRIASVSQQYAIIEELDKAAYHIERNANGKMLFQALTIRLSHIIQSSMLPSTV